MSLGSSHDSQSKRIGVDNRGFAQLIFAGIVGLSYYGSRVRWVVE